MGVGKQVRLADDSSGTKRECQAATLSELAIEQKVGRTNDFVKAAITLKSSYDCVWQLSTKQEWLMTLYGVYDRVDVS